MSFYRHLYKELIYPFIFGIFQHFDNLSLVKFESFVLFDKIKTDIVALTHRVLFLNEWRFRFIKH